MPGDTGSDTGPTVDQSHETSEGGIEERKGDDEVSIVDSRLARSSSSGSPRGQTCHDSSSTVAEVNRRGSHNTMEQSEKCHPSYSPEHEFLLPDASENLPKLLSAESECHDGNTCEKGHPASRPHHVDTDRSKDEGSKEDCQMEVELTLSSVPLET